VLVPTEVPRQIIVLAATVTKDNLADDELERTTVGRSPGAGSRRFLARPLAGSAIQGGAEGSAVSGRHPDTAAIAESQTRRRLRAARFRQRPPDEDDVAGFGSRPPGLALVVEHRHAGEQHEPLQVEDGIVERSLFRVPRRSASKNANTSSSRRGPETRKAESA
jgi:hypothetical protein